VVAVASSDGTTVEKVKYDPYGQATVTVQQGQSASGNPYLFQGRRWDDEVDLYYFRNRVMSPLLGRFLQRDPLEYTRLSPPAPSVPPDRLALFRSPRSRHLLCKAMAKFPRLYKSLISLKQAPGYSFAANNPACRIDSVGLADVFVELTCWIGWRLEYDSYDDCVEEVSRFCDPARKYELKHGIRWVVNAVKCGLKYGIKRSGVPGAYDKWKHCMVGCETAKDPECGAEVADYLGWENECIDASDFIPGSIADLGDVEATQYGADISCEDTCEEHCDKYPHAE